MNIEEYFLLLICITAVFLIILAKSIFIYSKSIEKYNNKKAYAHFGGIPNDSQLWGYQQRTIF